MLTKPTCYLPFLFITFLFKQPLFAQPKQSKWQIGANAGVFIYQGDLTPSIVGSYKTPSPVFGLYVNRVITPSFAVRANIAAGMLRGNDAAYNYPAYRQQRNFKFATPVAEVSALVVWNIFGNNGNELGNTFSPYAFVGVGASFIKVARDFTGLNKSLFSNGSAEQIGLAADLATTPPTIIPVIPLGIGVEYYVSPKISLTFETNFRYTFTDYIDGFKFAANPAKKDYYHAHTIGVLYRFGGKEKLGCPVMNF